MDCQHWQVFFLTSIYTLLNFFVLNELTLIVLVYSDNFFKKESLNMILLWNWQWKMSIFVLRNNNNFRKGKENSSLILLCVNIAQLIHKNHLISQPTGSLQLLSNIFDFNLASSFWLWSGNHNANVAKSPFNLWSVKEKVSCEIVRLLLGLNLLCSQCPRLYILG